MQIHFRAGDFDLARRHAAQSVAQGRHALRDHAGVGDDGDVALQRVTMFLQEIWQVIAPDFFFAFDDEVEIDREIAVLFQRLLDAKDVGEDLPFVIRRTARKDVAVL